MQYSKPCKYSIKLITKLKSLDTQGSLDFALIDKAIHWAKKYHSGQFRKSGEEFYTHPLEVAYIISDYLITTDVIVASILHDIVEDTEVTIGMILDAFNWRITEIVDRLTRDRPNGRKLTVEEILNNAYENNDREVILIKLMDRLHNLHTINFKSQDKIEKTLDCSLTNFSSICLLFDDINIEQTFVECFSKKKSIVLNPYVTPKQILSRALENA